MSALIVMVGTLPGCIANEIRDNLMQVNESLTRTNATLDLVISELGLRLKRLEGMDASLVSIDGELDQIQVSLVRLDDHMVSLRRTLQNIDKTIPFLKLADDETVEDRPEEGTAETDQKGEPPASNSPQ